MVGVIIPSILTFYGGIITYLFLFGSKETTHNPWNVSTIILSIISISFFLILGTDYGADMRQELEVFEIEKSQKHELNKLELELIIKYDTLSHHMPYKKQKPTTDKVEVISTEEQ